jgi:hypothetical protein
VQVFNFVKLAELYYAGSHGMDIKGPTAQSKHTKAKVRKPHYTSFQLVTAVSHESD